jgi:hypothetical protein
MIILPGITILHPNQAMGIQTLLPILKITSMRMTVPSQRIVIRIQTAGVIQEVRHLPTVLPHHPIVLLPPHLID